MFSNAHRERNGGQRPPLRFIGTAIRVRSCYPRQAFFPLVSILCSVWIAVWRKN